VISISQLIVCNSLAPFLAVYLSRDVRRSRIQIAGRLLSAAPIILLLGISYRERQRHASSDPYASLLLCCVLFSSIISQACARYVARNKSPSWSQPRLTILNAIFLGVVIGLFSRTAINLAPRFTGIGLIVLAGATVYTIQRFYVFGLKKMDPFISAMTLCTIVPLSLGTEVIFENRIVDPIEIVLAVGYVLATAVTVKFATQSPKVLPDMP
jgi:drug/metabolite transporter (DMT)-like permease